MLAYEPHCALASEAKQRRLGLTCRARRGGSWAFVAALALGALLLGLPTTAQAYRRGLGSSLGGATLGQGHVLWIAAGYPVTGIGWAVALHPRFDLGVNANVSYGNPANIGEGLFGGGGGVTGRFALLRGRTSAALNFGLAATAFSEGSGAAAFVDLGSPAVMLSFRVARLVAIHGGIRVVLHYITEPADFVGGFEARGGTTIGLTSHLALTLSAAFGMTIWGPYDPGTARVEVMAGVEYRLGNRVERARTTEDEE